MGSCAFNDVDAIFSTDVFIQTKIRNERASPSMEQANSLRLRKAGQTNRKLPANCHWRHANGPLRPLIPIVLEPNNIFK